MTSRRYPESTLQQQSAKLMRTCLREGAFAFHPRNEHESAAQRRIGASHGVMPGAADWVIFAPVDVAEFPRPRRTLGRAFCIELKAGRNQQTTAQKGFEVMCGEAGVPYRVCRSVDEVLEALEDWSLLRPGVRRTAG